MNGGGVTCRERWRRYIPGAGTGYWVRLVIGTTLAVGVILVGLQLRQVERTEKVLWTIRDLRTARLELAKGSLYLSQADEAGSAFERGQGLALLRRAMGTLESKEQAGEVVLSAAMREALAVLRERSGAWPAEGARTPGQAAEMRAVFHAVEREADGLDLQLQARVERVSVDNRREFLAVTLGAGLTMVVFSAVILLLQRRGARAARETREAEQRFAAVMENLGEGLILADAEGRLLHCNPAVLAMHGLASEAEWRRAADAVVQNYALETLTGERLRFEQWPLQRLLRGEPVRGLELRLRRIVDGWERVFSYGGGVVSGPGGVRFAFLTIGDVSARNAAERALRELNGELEQRVARRTAELEAKNRELETFTYSVSHDLKAPLRGIDGYSRLLLEDYEDKLDADGRRFLGLVRQASTHMGRLIDDLLAYSRLERRAVQAEPVPARALVRSLLEASGAEIEARGVRILETVPEELTLSADGQGLAMALRNLIDNALKFTRDTERPVIEVGGRREGEVGGAVGVGVLWVKDNGIGFDMRFSDRIFEIFQRLHRAEDYPGTGIGLALVRKAMERAGGRVWAVSALGGGSTFFLELPLQS